MKYETEIKFIKEIRENQSLSEEEKILKIFDYLSAFESPIKEYIYIISDYDDFNMVLDNRNKFVINNYEKIMNCCDINDEEKFHIKEAVFNSYYKLYDYIKSENMINELLNKEHTSFKTYYIIALFYILTRRYEEANELLNKALKNCDEVIYQEMINNKFVEIDKKKKRPYSPAKEENIINYKKIMELLKIEYIVPEKRNLLINRENPFNRIDNDLYPSQIFLTEHGFKNFVAFDVETTGLNSNYDAIIELSAIRIVDGEIIESEEFIFSELVYPYKKSISKEIEELTGINSKMLRDSRNIWDVFNDFANWLGDDILLGYNCNSFDSKFLLRAGKLSDRVIYNKYYDVLKLVNLNIDVMDAKSRKLNDVCEALNIQNETAHRALSDSIATAKVYLKLLNMDTNNIISNDGM